ncbi:hypothetical protein JT359_17215 [Candidatus Poribacteria bacterium]|nr:hypothetical protein [Candidatus Poribacteria bacterium]
MYKNKLNCASMGLRFMTEAILEILFYEQDGPPLSIWEITKRLQLFNSSESPETHIPLILELLTYLEYKNSVYTIKWKEIGWKISPDEAVRIRDNLNIVADL